MQRNEHRVCPRGLADLLLPHALIGDGILLQQDGSLLTGWTYRGPATLFTGKFSSGQTVSAQMTGDATDYDPRDGSATTVSRPRDPNVEGPGGYFFAVPDAPGVLTFVAPATGTYRFSFSPCAMWGAPGAVRICAR